MIKPHHQACTMMIIMLGCALGFAAFHNYAAIVVFMLVAIFFGWRACKLHDDYKLTEGE